MEHNGRALTPAKPNHGGRQSSYGGRDVDLQKEGEGDSNAMVSRHTLSSLGADLAPGARRGPGRWEAGEW